MVRALAGCAVALALTAALANDARASSDAPDASAAVAVATAARAEDAAPAQRDLPAAPARIVASAPTLILEADLATQRLTVREGGQVLHEWPISSGRAGFGTPRGTFRPTWMAKSWFSRKYDNAPMPHAVFFNGGIAFHGTTSISMLGRPASHGCVRLAPANAARLYQLVRTHGLTRTQVVVHGMAKFERQTIAAAKNKALGGRGKDAVARGKGKTAPAAQAVAAWPWDFFQ
jgi:lipoprotein-anchoring transpeptidase ErfK/SrfK